MFWIKFDSNAWEIVLRWLSQFQTVRMQQNVCQFVQDIFKYIFFELQLLYFDSSFINIFSKDLIKKTIIV